MLLNVTINQPQPAANPWLFFIIPVGIIVATILYSVISTRPFRSKRSRAIRLVASIATLITLFVGIMWENNAATQYNKSIANWSTQMSTWAEKTYGVTGDWKDATDGSVSLGNNGCDTTTGVTLTECLTLPVLAPSNGGVKAENAIVAQRGNTVVLLHDDGSEFAHKK